MNRIMFYNKLDRYKLQHGLDKYGRLYLHKLDNYYPDGTARYFYSEEDWKAYQDGLKRNLAEKAKKAEQRADMSGYNDWKKNQTAQEEAKKSQANKLNEISDQNKQKQAEQYNKNAAAAEAEGDREKYRREREAEWGRRKAIYNKQEQVHNDAANIRRNSAADNAEGERVKARIEGEKKANAAQTAKYQRKKKLEAKQYQDKVDEIKRQGKENMEKAEAQRNAERAAAERARLTAEHEKNVKIAEAQKAAAENMSKQGAKIEEAMRARDAEVAANAEARKKYKDDSLNEIKNDYKDIYNGIAACAEKRDVPFEVNNELLEIFKHKLAQKDPEFITRWNGDVGKYVQPWSDPNLFDWDGRKDDEHKDLAIEALNEVIQEAANNINDNTTAKDVKTGSTYLTNLKNEYKSTRDQQVIEDMAKAKIALSKIYLGESESLKNVDPALKKVIDSKIEEVDDDYDGDLVAYIRPWIFGKWLPDDDDYAIVEDILEEMERELKSGKKDDEIYAEYMDKIKDQVF